MKPRAIHLLPTGAALMSFALGMLRPWDGAPRVENSSPRAKPGHAAAGAAAADPIREATAAALACRGLRDVARLGALVGRLDAAQMGAFLTALEQNERLLDEDLLTPVFTWWLARDPAAASAWIEGRLKGRFARPRLYGERSTAISAWARLAPEAALRVAREHPDHAFTSVLLATLLAAWPDTAPGARLEILRQFPPGNARLEAMEGYLSRAMSTATPAGAREAAGLAGSFPEGAERQAILEPALRRLATSEPLETLGLAAQFGLADSRVWNELVTSAGRRDAAATAAWLTQGEDGLAQKYGAVLARAWCETDVPTALAWASAQGVLTSWAELFSFTSDTFLRDFARAYGRTDVLEHDVPTMERMVSPLQTAFERNPQAAFAWLSAQPAGAERDRLVELVAGLNLPGPAGSAGSKTSPTAPPWPFASLAPLILQMPPEDAARTARALARNFRNTLPVDTLHWVESLPPGPLRTQGWIGLGGAWNNFAAALQELPAGPDRDAYLAGRIERDAYSFAQPGGLPERDEAAVYRDLQAIRDPALRAAAFDQLFAPALSRTPTAAATDMTLQALERAPAPEAWKAPWRERLRPAGAAGRQGP